MTEEQSRSWPDINCTRHDQAQGLAQVLPHVPLLPVAAGWSDIFLTYYHHPGRKPASDAPVGAEARDIDSGPRMNVV